MSATLLFVGGTIGGIIISRMGLGMSVFLTGKYKIYSILLFIVCILYLGRLLPKRFRRVGIFAAVLLSIGLWVNSYFNEYQFALNQYMQRRVDLANWKKEARINGVELTDYPYKAPEVNLFDEVDFENFVTSDSLIDDVKILGDEVVFFENDLEAVNQQVYFILKSDTKTYYFSTRPQRNNSRIGIFRNYFQNGFTVNVSRFDVDTDFYQAFVMIRNKDKQLLMTNGKLIRIDGLLRKVLQTNW
jgi:energy-coupling factor transporter transmembrane protein EcfT